MAVYPTFSQLCLDKTIKFKHLLFPTILNKGIEILNSLVRNASQQDATCVSEQVSHHSTNAYYVWSAPNRSSG